MGNNNNKTRWSREDFTGIIIIIVIILFVFGQPVTWDRHMAASDGRSLNRSPPRPAGVLPQY